MLLSIKTSASTAVVVDGNESADIVLEQSDKVNDAKNETEDSSSISKNSAIENSTRQIEEGYKTIRKK